MSRAGSPAPEFCRFWNDATTALQPYVPGEQPRQPGLIKLNTNECPYPPSAAVAAAVDAAAADLRLYPDPGSTALRRVAAEQFELEPERIFAGNGSDEVLAFAFQAFFDVFRPVAFADITYSFYPVYARSRKVPWRTIALSEDFTMPLDELLAAPEHLVLANPNAPTGIALTLDQLDRICAVQSERLVLVDEAYFGFGAESALPLLDHYDNLLVVRTLSKSHALAGLRLGLAIGDPLLIRGLERVRDCFNSYPVDRLAQAGGAAALADTVWMSETSSRIQATRSRTTQSLTDLGCQVLPSQANFIFVRTPDRSGAEIAASLRAAGILVRHFAQPRIRDFLRVTIGSDDQMDRLIEVWSQLI